METLSQFFITVIVIYALVMVLLLWLDKKKYIQHNR